MTWVQVECSNGSRYAAPSHSGRLPNLSGAAQLFQQPLSLRCLQTFELKEAFDGLGVEDKDNSINDGVAVTVLADQRDLGGHLGFTTVLVGGQCTGNVEDTELLQTRAESSLCETCSSRQTHTLRLLLERTFAILARTNDRGVTLLLDALCTRAPPPLTAAAASRLATVREDDGGPHVPPALVQARGQLDHRTHDSGEDVMRLPDTGQAANQRFLLQLTQGRGGDEQRAGPLRLLPSNSVTAAEAKAQTDKTARALSTTHPAPLSSSSPSSPPPPPPPPLPISHVTATRRRAFLFFVEHNVLPLSLLHTQVVYAEAAKPKLSKSSAIPDNGATPDNSAISGAAKTPGTFAATELLQRLALHLDPLPKTSSESASTSVRSSWLSCSSPLQHQPSKTLKRSPIWSAVAQTAEESSRLLLLCVFRLLGAMPQQPPLTTTDAVVMEVLLTRELWNCSTPFQSPLSPLVPMVAAYSPSGLLTASVSYRCCLTHDEQMLISATAIDRLTRFDALPSGRENTAKKKKVSCADVLRWVSWPLRIADSTRQIVDVLLLTVGDALAICLCFPRTAASTLGANSALTGVPPISPAVIAALSLQNVQQLLEKTVAEAAQEDVAGADGSNSLLNVSLVESLVVACTRSTKPYTPAFHDALFAATAVESALGTRLRDAEGDDTASSLLSEKTPVLETNAAVAAELRQMLRSASNNNNNNRSAKQPDVGAAAPQTSPSSSPSEQQQQVLTTSSLPAAATVGSGNNSNGATATAPAAAAPKPKSRGGLQKLFACLPLRRRSSSRNSKAPTSVFITPQPADSASVQQCNAHIEKLDPQPRKEGRKQRAAREAQEVESTRTAALLGLPLECLLCFVAAIVTRNEYGALRSLHAVGLHSFFFLQQSVAAQTKRKGGKLFHTPCQASNTTTEAKNDSAKASLDQQASLANSDGSATTAATPRYSLSFVRACLQQPQCPSAVVPNEWADAEGLPDGQGGTLTFIEDPTLTLQLAAQLPPEAHPSQRGTAPLPSAVSTVPCWSILHLVPVEPVAARHEGDVASLSDSFSSFALHDGGISGSCPASAEEDAQLLTSLSFSVYQKLHQPGLRARRAAENRSSSSFHVSPAQLQPTSLVPSGQTGILSSGPPALHANAETAQNDALHWTTVTAVMNICGDVEGGKAHVLLHALERQALSAAAKSITDGAKEHHWKGDTVSAAVPADSDPAEFEYAIGASAQLRELFHEALLCQEAAMTLLEAASGL